MKYIAFIHKEDNNYLAVVPDLNYTSSFGSTFEEAISNIIEASELYCEDLKKLPKSSSLEDLNSSNMKIENNATPQLLNIKVEKLTRINVMMRKDLLDRLPQRLIKFNNNRSTYIQELIVNDLENS